MITYVLSLAYRVTNKECDVKDKFTVFFLAFFKVSLFSNFQLLIFDFFFRYSRWLKLGSFWIVFMFLIKT